MELRSGLRVRITLILSAAALLITAVFGVLSTASVQAAQSVPYKVNFQGRLTDNSGNILSDGLYNIKFRLWTAASGGSNVWQEDRAYGGVDNRIQVTNGLFNIQFGDVAALSPSLFSGAFPLYLEVELPTPATATCASNGCASFTEGAMTPRQTLASSPYAFNADTVDGLDSTAFSQLTAANTFIGANLFAPTAASTVALTVKATTAGGSNALEVFDSAGTRQAYFDASGNLNVARTIQATSNNAIDVGSSGTAFRSGYFGTAVQSPSFTGSGAVSVSSGSGTDLTLAPATGILVVNATTLRRNNTGFTLDLSTAATSTLTVTNSNGVNVANLDIEGGITIGSGQTYKINGTQISSSALSNDTNITKQGNTFNGASQLVQLNGSTQLPVVSGANLTNLNPTNLATGSGSVTLQSGAAGGLTLTSASGTIALGSATIQRSATSLTLDINNAASSTLTVTNAGTGTASVSIDAGGSYTGAGAINLSSGGATALSVDTGGAAAIIIGATNATSIAIGGNAAGTITQNVANSSASAMTIQTAAGTDLLTFDTAASQLKVGVADANATLLVLDSKSGADPTGANGGMYYNSTTNKFRCFENSVWKDCDTTGGASSAFTRIAGSSGAAGADVTLQRLTSNSANVTTTALSSAVMSTTGLGAGTWKFKYTVVYQSAAVGTGIGLGVNHTGAGSVLRQANWAHVTTGGAATTGVGDNVAGTVAGQMMEGKSGTTLNAVVGSASAGVAVANTNIMATFEGIVVVTNSGTLELKIASETAGTAVRLISDSLLELTAF